MKLIINCSSGTEASVKRELLKLGILDAKAFDGKIEVEGDFNLLANLCIWLRCADRIFIELAKFQAITFDELFDNVSKIEFGKILKKNTKVFLDGNCFKSKLMAIKTCGSVIKKSIMNVLENEYGTSAETDESVTIYFTIINDICTIMFDACGNGLHKRGYRELTYTAPLKETLACSLLDLSVYSAQKTLADVFCGSGTIAIEAAMLARNIAPGLNRNFDFEKLKSYPVGLLESVKQEAKEKEIDIIPKIYASDINKDAIKMARKNAKIAGVEQYINFSVLDMENFSSNEEYGIIISNPPYGDRLSTKNDVKVIYKKFCGMFKKLKNWSCYILTNDKDFEKFMGRPADKKRKLYNARLECIYYSFMGKKPSKKISDV